MQYLVIEEAKNEYFDFAVYNKGCCNAMFSPRRFTTVLEVANKFVLLLNHLLDNAEKSVYVNADEVAAFTSKIFMKAKKALIMKTSEGWQPHAHCIQAKQGAKKVMHARVPKIQSDAVIKKENI